MSDKELQNEKETHIAIEVIKSTLDFKTMQVHNSLKDATDSVEGIIKNNPLKQYKVFQLRAVMQGDVQIKRKDFNN